MSNRPVRMSAPRSPAAARRAAATLTTVAAAALAGCSAAPSPVALPPHAPAASASPSPAASPSPTATPSVRDQVVAAVLTYADAVNKASASGNRAAASRLLAPYLQADEVGGMVSSLAQHWSKGEFYYGVNVAHLKKVTIRGTVAQVNECDDGSSASWRYKASGKIVPSSLIDPLLYLRTTLRRRSDGRWIVDYQTILATTCTP